MSTEEEIRDEGRKALKLLIPVWLFNALLVMGTWFAFAWSTENTHWTMMAWQGLLITWCLTKTLVSVLMVIAFLKFISGKRPT